MASRSDRWPRAASLFRWAPAELALSLLAVAALTGLYWVVSRGRISGPGSVIGLTAGIIGFVLMLSTQTLYTIRKRWRGFHLGQMRTWLQAHVFTGIVGPYLVLLHSGGKFHGLAGVVMLLTVLMVVSGFVGRYIYTATPRTLGGAEVDPLELEERIADMDRQLRALDWQGRPGEAPPAGWSAVVCRPWLRWRYRRRVHTALGELRREDRLRAHQLEKLLCQRFAVYLQIHSLAATRRLLALWHLLHVPLGGVLFALAFVHIGAALYYGTFSR